MSSRYRYNSQSYYNRSTGGQTNNPRVINRPYGVGYTSNQSDNVKSWAYNLMHSGYYVNDSLESMANQLIKNGYYVSTEPPLDKILITKYSITSIGSTKYQFSKLNWTNSSIDVNVPPNQLLFYIVDETSNYRLVILHNESTETKAITMREGYFYSMKYSNSNGINIFRTVNDTDLNVISLYDNSEGAITYYCSKETFIFDLPNK